MDTSRPLNLGDTERAVLITPEPNPVLVSDVIETIIAFIGEYVRCLSICSLVCKMFVFPCRRRIFRHVFITPRNCDTFLYLLGSPRCTIQHHVRTMFVSTGSEINFFDNMHENCGPTLERIMSWTCPHNLLPISAALDSLHSMRLDYSGWSVSQQHSSMTVLSSFDTLTSLELRSMYLESINQLMDFVCAFPALSDLAVGRPKLRDRQTQSFVKSTPGRLQHLEALSIDNHQIIEWLIYFDIIPSLASLKLSLSADPSQSELASYGTLIRALGSSLRHLQICNESPWTSTSNLISCLVNTDTNYCASDQRRPTYRLVCQ